MDEEALDDAGSDAPIRLELHGDEVDNVVLRVNRVGEVDSVRQKAARLPMSKAHMPSGELRKVTIEA